MSLLGEAIYYAGYGVVEVVSLVQGGTSSRGAVQESDGCAGV